MRETSTRHSPTHLDENEKQILVLRWACLGVVVILVLGLWAQMPYLTVEHRRLEPYRVLELWCFNILALFWFGRFLMEHAVLGAPLTPVPVANARTQLKRVAITGGAALLLELFFTVSLMLNERDRHAHALVTQARVEALRLTHRAITTWYEADVSFADASGNTHRAHIRVEAERHRLPASLSPAAVQTLTRKEPKGGALPIRYDPQFPGRAWADGTGWDDGQRIYWFSLLTLFFQSIVTALFLLFLKPWRGEFLPWWWDVYKVLPLLVGGFWLFAMGMIDRWLD